MFKTSLPRRILATVGLLVASFFVPWWFVLFLAVIVFFLYGAPELLIVGVVLDALHAEPQSTFFGSEFVFTLIFLALFILILQIKKRLINY